MKKILVRLAVLAVSFVIIFALAACSDERSDKVPVNSGSQETEQGAISGEDNVGTEDETTPPSPESDESEKIEQGGEKTEPDIEDTEPFETEAPEPEPEPEPEIYDENGKLISKEEFLKQRRLVIYPDFPEEIVRNYDYSVSVTMNGRTYPLTVYNHTMEYNIFGRSIGCDLYRRFARFAFSGGPVRVDIKVSQGMEAYSVIPSAKNFKSEFKDGVISVFLDEPEYFLIRLDNDDNSLISICADYPEYPGDIPSKNDPNVLYVDDWYETDTGILEIDEPNTIIYLEPQAVLNCRVRINKDAVGSKMFGRGAVVDPFSDIYNYKIRDGGTEGSSFKLTTLNCENGYLEGLFYLDTRAYNIAVNASGIKVENVKCFSTLMTTDGISVYSGTGAKINHCLLYVGDNALVYSATDSVFTDITIGTTCASLFPQGATYNSLFDGIYIFRSNDGVVSNIYNGSQLYQREHSNVIKNLDCMDCINIPHFFKGRKMGVLNKTFTFENISIPRLSGVTDPHIGLVEDRGGKLYILDNGTNYIYTDNYTLNFINFYIDGELLTDIKEVSYTNQGKNNVINISEDDEQRYDPIERQWNVVKYREKGVIYIGNFKFTSEHETFVRNGKAYFPTESILRCLRRTDAKPETVEIKGIKYSTGDALVACKAAAGFKELNDNFYFVPCYDGEELLLPDKGEISRFSEAASYQVDMEVERWNDNDIVYVMYDHGNYYTGGMSRMITEEIQMYGKGTYELSFEICGEGHGDAHLNIKYDDYMTIYTPLSELVKYSSDWKKYTFKINVTEDMADCEGANFIITGDAESKVSFFALQKFSLVKVK